MTTLKPSEDIAAKIVKLDKAARGAATATRPAQWNAARLFLIGRADELRALRDGLFNVATEDGRLIRAWNWLRDHETSTKYDKNLATYHQMVADYESIVNGLNAAQRVWLGTEVAA